MSDFLREAGFDFAFVVVDRGDVENQDVSTTLKTLHAFLADRETVLQYRGRIDLRIHGYNDDARELYEIDQVRTFIARLDKVFPYWFYFLTKDTGSLLMVTLCLCRYTKRPDRFVGPDDGDLEAFMLEHFIAMNRLCEAFLVDETTNAAVSREIKDYFTRVHFRA